ncbi:MAG: ATP-binding protein, partial [Parahaliea sp.]
LRWLYRRILSQKAMPPLPRADPGGQMAASELEAALAGRETTRWYRDATDSHRNTLSATAPVRAGSKVIGAVLLRQDGDEYLALTDRAFGKLLGYSLLATALAALGLLGYASVLSWRIGRLSRAAGRVAQRGRIDPTAFPRSSTRDEVGELSRRFADLLAELHTYNDYLQTLSRKLSHELRTPLAVIQSSLDNLGLADSGGEREVYIGRAREGLARLNRILTAMTEASRVEESVRGDPLLDLDLVPLLREILPAYQGGYPQHRLQLDCTLSLAHCRASPDLLVQALDKLVDNAASFADEHSAITLSLSAAGQHWELAVVNQGPPLPEAMQGQLFEAMVSMRGERGERRDAGIHLGLGLYITRLITEHLGGSVHAGNLPDGRGVRFSLRLPHSPQQAPQDDAA